MRRYILPLAVALFAAPAVAQQSAPGPGVAPSLSEQLDAVVTNAANLPAQVMGMRNLLLSQDATIKQLVAQNVALTKERDELKAKTPVTTRPGAEGGEGGSAPAKAAPKK